MKNVNEGITSNIADTDIEVSKVGIATDGKTNIKDNKSFEDFKSLYSGIIKMKCQQDYNTVDDKDLLEDVAKELYYSMQEYIPEKAIVNENKQSFNSVDKTYREFKDTARDNLEDNKYEFRMDQLGLTKEDVAEFKNLLVNDTDIANIDYDIYNNTYSVTFADNSSEEKDTKTDTEQKVEEAKSVNNIKFPLSDADKEKYYYDTKIDTNGTFFDVYRIDGKDYDFIGNLVENSSLNRLEVNKVEEASLSRLYQHTKNKDTFAIIGSQDQDTKQDRSSELKSLIGKVQREYPNIGFNQLEGTYTYETGEQGIENSFIIYNIPKKEAINIAKQLNQESIIWKDDNFFGFINQNGFEVGTFKNDVKNMTFDEKITNLYGSKLRNSGNQLAFAFECKLLETTSVGSNFSKQNSNKIVKFPVFKLDIPSSKINESVDQYKSSKEEFVDDLVKQIIDHFDDEDGWTRSDLQGYIEARCITTGEDENEILNMIDNKLAEQGMGI